MPILLAATLTTLHLLAQSESPTQGIPPRAAPTDYQARTQAGALTLAAEFLGHSIPSDPNSIVSEEYVVVEAALFGPAGAKATLNASDFSLRINGRKQLLPAAHFGLTFQSLKDPEWGPTESEKQKSKTSVGGSGGGQNDPPPPPPKMPIALRRAMEQRVQKSAFPEGERPLPQSGLLFFQYRGKADGINAVELYYNGKDAKAKLALQ
ncbi:MAG: hypothetical protein JNK48_25955 [Bryobacterales bacterium]|nr:hypothetical protein [Bryobacterales bacterium]